MIIRKQFDVEMSHRVVNCTTERCAFSVHGHHSVIEVFITSDKLDNGAMIMDFGLMKSNIKAFIDSFDHCHVLWCKDEESYKEAIKKINARWIELPMSPSAESLSLFCLYMINKILKATEFNNGEGNVKCIKVIWHETPTGYAEASLEDLAWLPKDVFVEYSAGVHKDWPSDFLQFMKEMGSTPIDKKYFINPKIKLQIPV